jgi:hypothetical protein
MDLAPDDLVAPAPGDLVHSARATYRVTGSREVESRVWCNRWALTLERLPGAGPGTGGREFHVRSYRRGETPAEFFGAEALP